MNRVQGHRCNEWGTGLLIRNRVGSRVFGFRVYRSSLVNISKMAALTSAILPVDDATTKFGTRTCKVSLSV